MDCIKEEIIEPITEDKVKNAKEDYDSQLNELTIGQSSLRALRDANLKFASQLGTQSRWQQAVDRQEEINAELQAQINSLDEQISTAQARLDLLLAIPEPERTPEQNEEIAELEATIKSLTKEKFTLETELTAGEALVAEYTQNVVEEQASIEAQLKQIAVFQDQLDIQAAEVEIARLNYIALQTSYDLSQQGIQNRIDGNEEVNFANTWETICAFGRTLATFEELEQQNVKQGAEYLQGLQDYNTFIPRQTVLRNFLNYIQSEYFNYFTDDLTNVTAYYDALPSAEKDLFSSAQDFYDSFNGQDPFVANFISKFPMYSEFRTQFTGSDFFTTKRASRDSYLKTINELWLSQFLGLEKLNQISEERGWNTSYIDPFDAVTYPISNTDANAVKEFFTNYFNSFIIVNAFGSLADYAFFDPSSLNRANIEDGTALVGMPADLASYITGFTANYFADAGIQQGLSVKMLAWYAEIAELTPYWNSSDSQDWVTTVRATNDQHAKAQNEVNLIEPIVAGGCYQQQPNNWEPPVCIGGAWNNLDGFDPEDPNPTSQEEYVAAMQPFVDDETAKYLSDASVYQQIINSLNALPQNTDAVKLYLDSYVNMTPQNPQETEIFDVYTSRSKEPFESPFKECEEGGTDCKISAQSTTAVDMLAASRTFKWSLSEIKEQMMAAVAKGECCVQITQVLKWETVKVLIKEGFQILINFTPSGIGNMITITWNTAQSPS